MPDPHGRKSTVPDDSQSIGVSIVIPAFHAKETIQRAVESVARQTGVDTEIIVVIDDGCADTEQRVQQLGLTNCRILMNDRNLGSQATRNRGLAEATQPFILFLDSDDYQSGDLLRGLVGAAREVEADLTRARGGF